tara:strand:- start:402 stop:1040 length:639 start_codon:yes stop_codon:yes gene_type:complete
MSKTKKLLLIGNGPSALNKKMGGRIDSNEFDKVIRFNRWNFDINGEKHIQDFSEYIGTRCDYWAINDNLFIKWCTVDKFYQMSQLYEKVLVYYPKFKYNPDLAKNINKDTDKLKNVSCISPKHAEDVINQIVDFKPKWPTTGVAVISWAMFSSFDEIYLYGFDSYDLKYKTKRYFEDVENTKSKDQIDHTTLLEKEYIRNAIKFSNKLKQLI